MFSDRHVRDSQQTRYCASDGCEREFPSLSSPLIAAAWPRVRGIVTRRISTSGEQIVLLSADGVGTNEIMRRTGKSKAWVWRWQERFMQAGYDGLLRDKKRSSRIPPLGAALGRRQDDSSAQHMLLRRAAVDDDRFKPTAIRSGDVHHNSCSHHQTLELLRSIGESSE